MGCCQRALATEVPPQFTWGARLKGVKHPAVVALTNGWLGYLVTADQYKAGKYDQALKEYEQLLERKGDDPRLHFNAGTAAYQNRQYDEATKQFDQAVSSPDLKLQELGYYNRGNSLFRLGEQTADPTKRTETWQKSLKDFELSMHLNPQDTDANFNHEFVKRKLEELKEQQEGQNEEQAVLVVPVYEDDHGETERGKVGQPDR